MQTQNGFTLIEFIIVIMLVSIIASVSSTLLSQGFTGYSNNKNINNADWQARTAIERMQRDLRAIRSPIAIVTATATQLVFVNYQGNTISYFLDNNSLMRQTNNNPMQVLADGVQSLTFNYLDSNGAATSTPNDICYISINLNIVLNKTKYTIATAVYPRNTL
jgi:prepilin-type N-terminal cleavage/methylation domain-containing protein